MDVQNYRTHTKLLWSHKSYHDWGLLIISKNSFFTRNLLITRLLQTYTHYKKNDTFRRNFSHEIISVGKVLVSD